MKRITASLLIFVLLFALVFNAEYYHVKHVINSITCSRFTVVIDPGHGGKDAGTSADDGTREKNINLEISLTLNDYLKVCGINTAMTREGDYELYPEGSNKNRSDLYNRLDFVNSIDKAVLISVHQNHFEDKSISGTQIWYSPNNAQSKELADGILNNIKAFIQKNNERNNKESDSSYYILYKASVPSIMIECGFMSNNYENELLKNTHYQRKLAFSILTGICGEV